MIHVQSSKVDYDGTAAMLHTLMMLWPTQTCANLQQHCTVVQTVMTAIQNVQSPINYQQQCACGKTSI